MTMSRRLIYALMSLPLAALPLWAAANGAEIAAAECASCHALDAPAGGDVLERSTSAAPPLYYAGSKFRPEWLSAWLENPSPIRPAGYFPPNHVVNQGEGDQVDPSTLPAHPKLDADRARAVADYLMTLKAPDGVIESGVYAPGSVALRMGMLDFRKFKGCNACHRDTPDEGGISGPELHTAWQRLQPDFIFTYIKNPIAVDAHSMMPVPEMNDTAVSKLADYLKVIGENAQ